MSGPCRMLVVVSWLIERRLRSVGRRLERARDDLAVAEEQLLHFVEDSDDATIRSLVSDDPTASIDSTSAQRHADAMHRHRDDLRASIVRLEASQDELLDRLNEGRRAP